MGRFSFVPVAWSPTHAALADEGGHIVVAEAGADCQGHELWWSNRRRSCGL